MVQAESVPEAFDAARELRGALRRLRDPEQLQENPLARTSAVRALARERYDGDACPEGRALRDLLVETIAQVDRDLAASGSGGDGETRRLRLVLRGLARGEGIATIGRALGIPPSSHSARLLYRVQHMLVRQFLQRAGQMAPQLLQPSPSSAYGSRVARGVSLAG
jgi:hypothetical protein